MIVFYGRCESASVSSIEDMSKDEFDTSFMILHSKWKEACLRINIQNKTIGGLHKEPEKLSLTIISVEKEVASLNSKIDNLMQLESNLKTSSNSLDGAMEFGDMFSDMKRIDLGMSMKEMKVSSKKVVIPEKKTKVLMSDHMSQHRAQHMLSYHHSNKK